MLTRDTDGTGANSGPAAKTWVNARIAIAPNATNEVGQPHTFTVTLEKDTGTGGFVAAAGEHVDFTLTDSNGAGFVLNAAASTCDNAGANTERGRSVHDRVQLADGRSGDRARVGDGDDRRRGPVSGRDRRPRRRTRGDAVKTFVDANIQITPQTATNPVGTNHTFTVTVMKNAGLGGGFVAAAGEHVTASIVNSRWRDGDDQRRALDLRRRGREHQRGGSVPARDLEPDRGHDEGVRLGDAAGRRCLAHA